MKGSDREARATRPSSLMLLSLATIFTWALAASAQEKPKPQIQARPPELAQLQLAQTGKIEFSPNLVPPVRNAMPLIRLAPQKPPVEFLHEILGKAGVKPENIKPLARAAQIPSHERLPEELIGVMEEGRLRAHWNLQTGDAEVFPILTNQKPENFANQGRPQLERAAQVAREVFNRPEILGKDATQFKLGDPIPVLGTSAERAAAANGKVNETARTLYMTYVPVLRTVAGYPVFGPGSRAMVAVGNDGAVHGFVRRWKVATGAGEVKESRSPEAVRTEIMKQLEPFARAANVSVLTVELAYFDGQGETMLPVYRTTARLQHLSKQLPGVAAGQKRADDDYVVLYLPVAGGALLQPAAGPLPSEASPKASLAPEHVPEGDPTVGRYVVRNDDSNWVADANEFWNGLTSWGGGAFFANSQYFWAHPWEFTTSEGGFVNSVQVALNEVHGNWWYFTTYQNWGEGVDITTIPASEGYGSANHGSLAYWILHSCEVVPSAMDAPCPSDSRAWWTPWFNIFQGLHTVVGYRTIMYIDDDAGGPYGTSLRFGAPVVSAWFNATLSAPDYWFHPTAQAHCGNSPPMGKPSTISVCGHQDDNVYNTSPLSPAGCLINFWAPN